MDNCPVKLLVAATPTSGPHFISKKQSLNLAREDVGTLTIETTLAFFSLAILTDCRTSAVSPLWEIAMSTAFSSIKSEEYWNSLDKIASTRIFEYLERMCLANNAA